MREPLPGWDDADPRPPWWVVRVLVVVAALGGYVIGVYAADCGQEKREWLDDEK